MKVDFIVRGLEELQGDINKVAERYPDELNKKMRQLGREFTKDCNSRMPPEYESGKKSIPKSWKVTVDHVRHVANQTYIKNKAPHFHLVENGHEKFIRGKDTGGFVPGKHYVEETVKQYEEKFPEEIEEFLEEMLQKGGLQVVRYSDLIKALNSILEERYPDIGRYGNDTREGWEKPYFFVECVPYESNYETKNFLKKSCSMKVTYFQAAVNELEQLEKVEEIREAIGMKFHVAGRKLDVRDYTHDYAGEHNNILQISFRLDWFENRCREPELDKMETVEMAMKKGES